VATDKRELILDLLARDKSGPATKSFARNLKDSGDAAEKASRSTSKFSRESAQAERAADGLGDEVDQAARSIGKLDREIALASAELRVLAKSFADTDDAAERLDISKAIRRGENDIRRLSKSKSLLKVKVDPEVDRQSFGKKLAGMLSGAGGDIAGVVGKAVGPTIGIAIGAAAAPVILSSVASAISAGAGAAGIGAGIMLAVKADTGIQTAGKELGSKFLKGVTASATKNFAGPIRAALGILDDAAGRTVTKVGKMFDSLGGSVVPFTRDVVQAAERLVDAFTNVASKSGPALAGLGDTVRLLADGVGDFIEIIADGGPEAAANLEMIAGATADVLRYSGLVLKVFSDLANNEWITGPLLPLLRKHYQDAADDSDKLKGSTSELATQMTDAQKAADGERTALDELSKELRAQSDPVFALLDAQDKLAEAQKNVSDETKKHGKTSKEAKKALRELAEAALDLEGKAGALGETFKGELTPQMRATLRAAGLTDDQIAGLAKQFRGAKKDGDRFARQYAANVKVNGVKRAKTDLRSVREIASDIPRAITIAMHITGVSNVSKARASINKQYEARAAGGPIEKDTPYWVGENGPELVLPDHNGRVLSAAASRAGASRIGPHQQGGGGGGGKLQLEVVGEAEMVRMFRSLIRRANLLQVGA
jgi:methyl-accepting chemotaxis protein